MNKNIKTPAKTSGLKVKTLIKAGGLQSNHNVRFR